MRPPPFELTVLPKHKLGERVAARLLDEIRSNGLACGTRMPSERELMAALGVGRSTVREALNGLALLGVIEIRHGQGAFVLDASADTQARDALARALARGITRDLLEARSGVEVRIAELAAERRTSADLRELRVILAEHEDLVDNGESAARLAAQFHVALAEAAHNEVLAGFVSSIRRLLVERGPALEHLEGYPRWELEEHRGLFVAVRARDVSGATERMRAHLAAMVEHHGEVGLT